MLMYVYVVYILLLFLVIWLATSGKEGYFTFYKGMPGIPKTYISTHFIRDPDQFFAGQTCIP